MSLVMRATWVVLLSVGTASAEDRDTPLTANVGIGLAADKWGGSSESLHVTVPGYADLGYLITDSLSITVHVGLSPPRLTHRTVYFGAPVPDEINQVRYMSSEVGLGLTYVADVGVWFTPWVGVEKVLLINADDDYHDEASLAFGLEAGVDVYDIDEHQHLSVGGKALYSSLYADSNGTGGVSYVQLGVGVAYRFW